MDYLIKVWFVALSKICVCKTHDEKYRESESCINSTQYVIPTVEPTEAQSELSSGQWAVGGQLWAVVRQAVQLAKLSISFLSTVDMFRTLVWNSKTQSPGPKGLKKRKKAVALGMNP